MNILRYVLYLLIFLALFLEGVIINLPLVFALCIASFVLFPDEFTLLISFLTALILDIIKVETIGLTLIFLAITFIIISLYRKSFEFADIKMVLLVVIISSFIYKLFVS